MAAQPEAKKEIPKLKYQSNIEALQPTQDDWKKYGNIKVKSFRWVFSDIRDPRNFTPRYAIPEIYRKDEERNKLNFEGWALSFFDTLDNARTNLKHHTRDKEFLFKKLGTHLAEGEIVIEDGLTELKCNRKGHFNHFEYAGTNFYNERFEIIECVFEIL